ncbi:GNAT family N-acetyltransferase [Streptomyces sp. NPDC029526]|uniref:GNAT family N-acetyltransferase n=1 Tax=Streptomyces sp. NPDC029526 TaxID=3155728 RepID=UPI0033FE1320
MDTTDAPAPASTADWCLPADTDAFLTRAGSFLPSRAALHTMLLTVTRTLSTRGPHAYGDGTPEFGVLERDGTVEAAFLRTPPHRLHLTPLTAPEADALAARLADLGRALPGVHAEQDTAAAFADAWRRRTGAPATVRERQRLYRLGELTVPTPAPPGRARVAGPADRTQLAAWYGDFCAAVGQAPPQDPDGWADARAGAGEVVLWELPDGTPAAMACRSPIVAGQSRVVGVYTPVELRGRGYAGAATAEVSRAAVAEGAEEVLLFTDLANPTSNGLYQRLGYRPIADFTVYDFGAPTRDAPRDVPAAAGA